MSMKLISKKDIEFVEGFLVQSSTGDILSLPRLAYEVNEIAEVRDFNSFLEQNRSTIEASQAKTVEYHPPVKKPARFELLDEPATPLKDEEAARKTALANEFLATQQVKDVNQHLARYGALAAWFASDRVMVDPAGAPSEFSANIFDLTENDVRAAVVAFNDVENMRLRSMVQFQQ